MSARPYLVAPTADVAGSDPRARAVTDDDLERLPALLVEAYRGTVDDRGETEDDARAELQHLLAGRSGPPMRDAWLVIEDGSGGLAAAALTTMWWGTPFLCFVVTAPAHRGTGLATSLIRRVAAVVLARGEQELGLIVTSGNPAEALYARIGFVERPRPS